MEWACWAGMWDTHPHSLSHTHTLFRLESQRLNTHRLVTSGTKTWASGGRGNSHRFTVLLACSAARRNKSQASMPPDFFFHNGLDLFSTSGLQRWENERMAEQRCGGDHGGLTDAAAPNRRDEQQHHNMMNSSEEAGAEDLSLEQILKLYSQPINEEQAWAVCYQCCRTLAKAHRGRRSPAAAAAAAAATGALSAAAPRRISGPGDVRIQRDGSVRVDHQGCEGKILHTTLSAESYSYL